MILQKQTFGCHDFAKTNFSYEYCYELLVLRDNDQMQQMVACIYSGCARRNCPTHNNNVLNDVYRMLEYSLPNTWRASPWLDKNTLSTQPSTLSLHINYVIAQSQII